MLRTARRAVAMLAALAIPMTVTACVQRPPLVVETSTGDIVRLESWTATLASSSAAIAGTATLAPATYREAVASITVSGASPNAAHAWYVQLGECGRDLGILAGPHAYPPIATDASGHGASTVTLPFTVPTSGRYYVTVRATDTHHSAIVACGNLTMDTESGGAAIAEARPR